MTTSDGWHTEPPSGKERIVLCQGKCGGFFLGVYKRPDERGMRFYVPNDRSGFRTAVAWHELPEPYEGAKDADQR